MSGLHEGPWGGTNRGPALTYAASNFTQSETEISYCGNKAFVWPLAYLCHKKN
jgi:hypothetical protein